jgi:N-acetylated-alpha-linked acidic dipeptidase
MFTTEKMPSESTPLIATVRAAPPRQRYSHHTIRRFFTIASASVLVVGFLFFAISALVIEPLHFHHPKGTSKARSIPYEQLKEILLETPSPDLAREWSKYYTAGPHLAGKNYSQVC